MKPGRVFEFGKLRALSRPTLMPKFLIPKNWYGSFSSRFSNASGFAATEKTQKTDEILRKKWDEFTANLNKSKEEH